jgi:hypothetical protein
MEDPIAFEVWLAIGPDKKSEAQLFLQRVRPEMPRLPLRQLVAKAALGSEMVRVAGELGWQEALALKAEAEAVGRVAVYQAGYGPFDDQRLHRCPEHDVRYGGCLGCPVCDGRSRA